MGFYNYKLVLLRALVIQILGIGAGLIYTVIFSEQLLFGEVETSEKHDDITYVSLEVLQNVIQSKSKILLIDGRSESAYHEGHIPGAVNIPYIQHDYFFRQLLADVARETPIIVYCSGKNCNTGVELAKFLSQKSGFMHVQVFEGGWEEWVQGENPIQTGFDR
ncbi:MAG: rhodanese-like domain-containing protein [Candidatus Latescibacteria bacterium]|nr:rhodanese-like domain-containing protein [Candidatus Latescibacterota bacterium]